MKDSSRQWGIDLARIISTYGIVLIHSGGYAASDNLAIKLQAFFRFALPFFIAASFYLLFNKKKEYKLFKLISSRWNRLVIPYLVWSLIYLIVRVIKALIISNNPDLLTLFQDPFSLIFFGSSALHLYFLPLLFTGNLFAILINNYTTNFKNSFILFFISLTIYNIVLQYSTHFSMKWVKFYDVFYSLQISSLQPLSKLLLIQGWFILICLPYIFFARMIYTYPYNNPFHVKIQKYCSPLLILLFLCIILFGRILSPVFITEPIFGCMLLIVALNFSISPSSSFMKNILLNLSEASFGIYLIHHLIVNFSQLLIYKIYPNFLDQISIFSLLVFSVSGFLISWLVVNTLNPKNMMLYISNLKNS
ncbi:MAG TPA: acyltransferase [Nodularia sp. (in: cyanobacteria)]|nr:acyltransferase [Nodularia sp. (in: cyanobacteria)]